MQTHGDIIPRGRPLSDSLFTGGLQEESHLDDRLDSNQTLPCTLSARSSCAEHARSLHIDVRQGDAATSVIISRFQWVPGAFLAA